MDLYTGYEPVGQEFESLRAHHKNQALTVNHRKGFFCFWWLLGDHSGSVLKAKAVQLTARPSAISSVQKAHKSLVIFSCGEAGESGELTQEELAWKPLAATLRSIPTHLNGNQTDAGTLSPKVSCTGRCVMPK